MNDFGVDDTKLNLDITAMIAYVSAMTNGRNWFKFQVKKFLLKWLLIYLSNSKSQLKYPVHFMFHVVQIKRC